MSNEARNTWETYAASWKTTDESERLSLLEAAVDSSAVYTDPQKQTETREDLIAYMKEFHSQVPGGHFETQWFLAHHGRAAVRWHMKIGDGTVVGEGVSYAEFGDDGKLKSMTGFFESA